VLEDGYSGRRRGGYEGGLPTSEEGVLEITNGYQVIIRPCEKKAFPVPVIFAASTTAHTHSPREAKRDSH
jgi:hypothetical protein